MSVSHLRVKRKQQTIFLPVDSTDTIQQLKEKISDINSVNSEDIKLFLGEKVCFLLLLLFCI